jgi:hypothetical protein
MADSVLYFPSIRVPETEWFTRVLLYWDSVGTIVPTEYLHDPQFLRPYTAGLRDYGLLKTVTPEVGVVWEVPNYYESFLRLVDSLGLGKDHIALADRQTVRIHVDKIGHGLASALVERGLGTHLSGQEWDAWFEVEKHTGNLLMAYLAAILGQKQEQRMDPITDSADCLEAFTRLPLGDGVVESRLYPIRTEILAELLPAPKEPVLPGKLAEFKGRYRDLLTGFRTAVEERVISAAAIEDPELRARSVDLMKRELKGQLEEITRRMQEHSWHRIGFGTLLAVVAGGVGLAGAAVTGGTLAIGGTSLGLVSAVYDAFRGARRPGDLLARPMAYAALAHRELGS